MEWFQQNILSEDYGVWFRFFAMLGVFLLGFWKALPAVLDAFERRQSGIELRTEALLDAQAKRFNEQLKAADDRHDECMEGQKQLRQEMAKLRRDYDELWGMYAAMRQGARSVEDVVTRTIRESKS